MPLTMKLLKEPLLQFLLLGAVIFAVHAARQKKDVDPDAAGERRIEVNAETITRLKEGWTRQFNRTPDVADLQGLVEAHVREEILYREALTLGLERDDTIVRRRLAQKMEFLTQDIANAAAPDEAMLEAYFSENASRYAGPAEVDFRHLYFSKEKRGEKADVDARVALEALGRPGASEEAFGDGFLQGFEFSGQAEQDIASIFGPGFATAVMSAPEGGWSGPIPSSYGSHLVFVTGRGKATPAEFPAVRTLVLRDLLEERRLAANEEVLARMKERYKIVVDESALKAAAVDLAKASEANP